MNKTQTEIPAVPASPAATGSTEKPSGRPLKARVCEALTHASFYILMGLVWLPFKIHCLVEKLSASRRSG